MSYLNVGATYAATSLRIPSKRQLRERMRDDPASVIFDSTSIFDDQAPFDGAHIPAGKTLSVVGPDPYTSRKWYATVTVTDKGLRVS